jgi:hypothetical protein
MVQVEVRRKQLAITGVVKNQQTGIPMGEVLVSIIDAPDAFVSKLVTRLQLVTLPSQQQSGLQKVLEATTNQDRLAAIQKLLVAIPSALVNMILPNRSDRTYTAADGGFYFADLPDGGYTITASLPQMGTRYGNIRSPTITVARDGESLIAAHINLSLPPTTLKGQITTDDSNDSDNSPDNVIFAEIRIQGSGEVSYSDAEGKYILTEIETSERERTIEVKASGFKSQTKKILFDEVGSEQILDFVMKI